MSDPFLSLANMTNNPVPILKLSHGADSSWRRFDLTTEIDKLHFDAGDPYGHLARGGAKRSRRSRTLCNARFRLNGVRSSWARGMLRNAATSTYDMHLEFFPDGEVPGEVKISGQCRVTATSLRAEMAEPTRRSDGCKELAVSRRDDEFVLSLFKGKSDTIRWS